MAGGRKPSGGSAAGRAKKKTAKRGSRSPAAKKKRGGTALRQKPPAKKKPAKKKSPKKKKPTQAKRNRGRGGKKTRGTEEAPVPDGGWFSKVVRILLCLVLSLLAVVTTVTFFQEIAAVERGPRFWTAAPVYFFALGVALLAVFRLGLPERALYWYVFGHELTHVIFIYLCGGKVYGDIRVSIRGGHVVTNKSNWLISLSPYFIPFYTVISALVFVLASPVVDLDQAYRIGFFELQPLYVLYTFIGFTWTLHIYYTLAMLLREQPDLQMNGTVLSLLVIYLVNSIIVMAFVAAVSKTLSLRGYIEAWFGLAQEWTNLLLVRLAAMIW